MSNVYCNPDEFQKLLIEYYVSDNDKKLANKVAVKLQQIAERLIESSKFRKYPAGQKEEMVQEAVCKMFMNLSEYNYKQYNNPFTFFTSITYNSFRLHLKKEKKSNLRTSSLESLEMNPGSSLANDSFRDYYDNKITQEYYREYDKMTDDEVAEELKSILNDDVDSNDTEDVDVDVDVLTFNDTEDEE